jgi:type I restriction enzyme S subunit
MIAQRTNEITLSRSWRVQPLSTFNARLGTINPATCPDETFEYYSIPAYQDGPRPILSKGSEIGSAKLLLDIGTVLFGKLNPRVEKVWRVGNHSPHRKIGSMEWLPLVPPEGVDGEFLYFLMWSEHVMPKAQCFVSGSTPSRQRVDPSSFYQIEAPLPPLCEQRKIAGVLGLVQQAMERQEQLLALTAELKKVLLPRLFTHGLRNENQQHTELGYFPENWELRCIGELDLDIGDGNYSTKYPKKEAFVTVGVPFLRANNVIDGRLSWNDMRYISPELHAELRKGHTKKDDVCLVTRGNIGEVAYVMDDFVGANMNAQLVRLNGRDAIDGKYLYFALAHPVAQKQFDSLKTGTALQQLPIGKLRFVRIPIPPKDEQLEIANYLWLVTQKLDLIQRKRGALSDLFRTLLHELMTARIRVHNLDLPELEAATP